MRAGLEAESHQCPVQGAGHCPGTLGHTIASTSQDYIVQFTPSPACCTARFRTAATGQGLCQPWRAPVSSCVLSPTEHLGKPGQREKASHSPGTTRRGSGTSPNLECWPHHLSTWHNLSAGYCAVRKWSAPVHVQAGFVNWLSHVSLSVKETSLPDQEPLWQSPELGPHTVTPESLTILIPDFP